jgi:hypothetical protein
MYDVKTAVNKHFIARFPKLSAAHAFADKQQLPCVVEPTPNKAAQAALKQLQQLLNDEVDQDLSPLR